MDNTIKGTLYLPSLHDTTDPIIINGIPRGDAIDLIRNFNDRVSPAITSQIGHYVEYNNFADGDDAFQWDVMLDDLHRHAIGERPVFFESEAYENCDDSSVIVGNVFLQSRTKGTAVGMDNSAEDVITIQGYINTINDYI